MTQTADFRSVFEQHKDAVYRFAWRMTNSPEAAEDIAQEVFLTLVRHPERFDSSRGELRPFLLGVARNLALKRYRDQSRWDELDAEFAGEVANVECLQVERAEVSKAVALAVGALPPLQREALILAEYEELSLDEIAHAVGADVGAVKARLHRARENLRRALAPFKPANSRR